MSTQIGRRCPPRPWWVISIVAGLSVGVGRGFGGFTYGLLLPKMVPAVISSYATAGLIASGYALTYIFGVVALVVAAARVSPDRLLTLGVGASTLGFTIMGLARSTGVSALGMVICGVGGAFSFVPALLLSHGCAPSGRKGMAVGIAGSGLGIGVVVSRIAAWGWLARPSLDGWRGVWATEAVLSGLILLAVAVLARQPIAWEHSLFSRRELWSISKLAKIRLMTFVYFCFGLSYSVYSAFAVAAWQGGGRISFGSAEDDLALTGVALAIGGIGFGWIWDSRTSRITMICSGFVLMALSALEVSLGASGWWAILSALAFGIVGSGVPSLIATEAEAEATRLSMSPSSGVVGFGIVTIGFGIGALLGPALGGSLAGVQHRFVFAFAGACGSAMLGAVVLASGASLLKSGVFGDAK